MVWYVTESQDGNASQTDLMALCSGKFVTQPPQPNELEGEGDSQPAAASPGSQSQSSSQAREVEKASQISALVAEDSVVWWYFFLVQSPPS